MTATFTFLARRQLSVIDDWWRENRRAAPDLFLDEFDAALEQLLAAPESGKLEESFGVDGLRVLSLKRTKYILFYRVVDETVRVVALWHGSRGTRPDRDDLAGERLGHYRSSATTADHGATRTG